VHGSDVRIATTIGGRKNNATVVLDGMIRWPGRQPHAWWLRPMISFVLYW
jgi:hypothetical protein